MNFSEAINQLGDDRFTAIALPLFVLAIVLESVFSWQQEKHLYQPLSSFFICMSGRHYETLLADSGGPG